MAARVAKLQRLYEEAGRPGARVFRTYARRKGEDLTTQEAQQFVAGQATAQVFQGRLPSDGKVTASREDMRWMGDLIDFSKRKKQPGGHEYALVVMDVFSRFMWVSNLKNKESSTVLAAYRRIVAQNDHKSPQELSTDLGKEWFGPAFQAYLKDQGTVHRHKNLQQVNSIAVVDRGVQTLKMILANLQSTSDQGWSQLTKKATSIYNDREHSHLYGESPEDVSENKVVQYHLEAEAGDDVEHNNKKLRQKAGRLKEKGAFREPLDRNTWERIDQPKFGGEVHEVDGLKGANVEDEEGRSYPVRQVLAVPWTSADINVSDELVPGSRKREQQRQHLRQYSEQLKHELSNTPRGEMSCARVGEFLRTRRGFEDTAETYRLPRAGRYVKFLRLFGFQIQGSGPGMIVRRPAAPSSAEGRGRPAGAVDIAPRAPRRGLPGGTEITFQPDNPHRGGTAVYTRYAAYRSATTVGEARRLGATPQDLRGDLEGGYAQLL